MSENYFAIQDQLRVQLHHILPRLLPSLYQVELILNDLKGENASNPELEELNGLLDRIHTKLQSTRADTREDSSLDTDPAKCGMPAATHPPITRRDPGEQANVSGIEHSFRDVITGHSPTLPLTPISPHSLRPPSPEARQQRKKSYGVL